MLGESWIYKLPLRWRSLFRRKRADDELDEELRFHVERKTEEYIGHGMVPEAARTAALRDLHGMESRKEECREMRKVSWLEDLWQDVGFGARMLGKSPGFSAVAILSIALGIGANTTIFTVVNAILLHALPVRDLSQLVQIDTVDSKTNLGLGRAVKIGMSYPNFQDYQRQNDVFSGLSFVTFATLTWNGGEEPRQLPALLVTANYFDVLGLQPAEGRFFLPDEDTKPGGNNVVVLSYSLWANRFGSNPAEVGSTMRLNATPYTVIGVGPRDFKGTGTFDNPETVWIPASMYPAALSGFSKDNFNDRRFLLGGVTGRLKPGVGMGQAEASLRTISSRLEQEYPKDNAGRSVALTPLQEAAVGVNDHDQFKLIGEVMMAVVGVVLLIACVNLANL